MPALKPIRPSELREVAHDLRENRIGVTIVAEPFELPVIQRKLAFLADPFGNLIELAELLG